MKLRSLVASLLSLAIFATVVSSFVQPEPARAYQFKLSPVGSTELYTQQNKHMYMTSPNGYTWAGPFYASSVTYQATVLNLVTLASLGGYNGPIKFQGWSVSGTVAVNFQSASVSSTAGPIGGVVGCPVAVSTSVSSLIDGDPLYAPNAFVSVQNVPGQGAPANDFTFYIGYQPQ